MRRFLLSLIIVTAVVLNSTAVFSSETPRSISLNLMKKVANLSKVNPIQLKEKVDFLLENRFASGAFLQSALWKYWDSIDEVRRNRLIEIFPAALSNNIVKKMKDLKNNDIRSFRLKGADNKDSVPRVVITGKLRNVDITIELFFRLSGDKWKIVDVIVNDASLRENYEGQFSYVIDKYGVDELIHRLLNLSHSF